MSNINNSNSKTYIKSQNNNIGGASNYINKSNIINENSSDNDNENSNINESQSNELYIREFRRLTLEYIKVLGIYQKEIKGELDMNDIMEEYKIPKEIIIEKDEKENINNKEQTEIIEDEDIIEEEIGFDNDIQPSPILNQEMKIIIYLTKPKIVGFNGKLGLFYISPPPIGKEGEYNIIVKNPKNMKIYYKIKISDLISCSKKNEYSLYFQNFGNKILMKTNHEMTFKNKDDCTMVHQGIIYLMNNREDDLYY